MTLPMNPNVLTDNSGNYLSQILLEIINSVSNPIYVKNRQHEWIFINNAFRQLTGYASEELTGKSDYDFFNAEEANIFREKDELIFTCGVSSDSEEYFTDVGGKVHIITTKKSLFNDEFGNQFLISTIKEIKVSQNKQLPEEKLNNFTLSVVKAISNLLIIRDLDESYNATLADLGSATNAEQISIIDVSNNRNTENELVKQRWQWSNRDIETEIDLFERWYKLLSQGEIIAGSVNDFPPSEREVLEAANIFSTLVIPIWVAGDFWGYIRFDSCQKEHEWLDREKSILQVAAQSLGEAYYRHQSQEKLIKSKNFLQLVVDSIPQIIFWKDCNSVFLGCNQKLADIWGLNSVEEIAGKTDDDVSSPKEKSDWYRELDKRVIESGVPELHIVEKKQQADGKQKWLDTNKIPLLDRENNVVGVLATIEDITERKQVEEALRQKEEFLRTIYDGVELGIIVYEVTEDNTFNYFGINKAAELFCGYENSQMVGKTPGEVVGEEFGKVIKKRNLDCLLKKESVSFEETIKVLDKEMFLLTTLTPLLDEKGRVDRIISTSTDITAQKQAEATLRESEEKFHQLSKNVPGMLFKFQMYPDGSKYFPYVSPGSYDLLGIKAETIQAESNLLISMIHPQDYKTFEKSLNNSAATLEPFYWQGRLVQASVKNQWVKAESRPQKQSDGSIIWDGFLSDITHLKRTEKALQTAYEEVESLVLKRTKELTLTNEALKAEIEERKNTEAALTLTEAKVQKLAANVPGMLFQFEVNPDGSMCFPYVSSGCYDIYGLKPEQIQADVNTIISMIHPDDLNSFKASLAISLNNLKPWEHEERIVISSGEVKWIKSHSRSEKLPNGTVLYHGFILDITEHKQAETERKQAEAKLRQQTQELENALLQLQHTQVQLIQSEKMSSLGQLVAGIAHEINNPVNFIDANLRYTQEYFDDLLKLIEIYQKGCPDNSEAKELIEEIEFDYLQQDLPNIIHSMKTGATRIADIVLSLRTFSRLDEAEYKKINIHESIESTLIILQNSLEAKPERIAIIVTKDFEDLPLVECFAGKLNQVFLNILNNAIDALEEAIQNQKFSEKEYPQIRISTRLIQQDTVQISIADNGCGIPEDNIKKLFDPFFTTKPVGKGTGLGLSMSYQIIVDRHEGELNCISTLGEGTEFQIQIPCSCKRR